ASHAGPGSPGFRRRRAHDAVAGTHRRDHTATRTSPLPGLPRRGGGRREHLRTGCRRLLDPTFWLAIGLSDQPAVRDRCHAACTRTSATSAASVGLAAGSARIRVVHRVCVGDPAGARAGTATRCAYTP